MIAIHRGAGTIVLIAGIVAALVMNVVTAALYDNDYYAAHIWPKFGTLWVAGLLCTGAGAYLRKHRTNVKDGDWFAGESEHHFFFIPVIYWGAIFFALGLIYMVSSFLKRG
jgi:hypothetical protein